MEYRWDLDGTVAYHGGQAKQADYSLERKQHGDALLSGYCCLVTEKRSITVDALLSGYCCLVTEKRSITVWISGGGQTVLNSAAIMLQTGFWAGHRYDAGHTQPH